MNLGAVSARCRVLVVVPFIREHNPCLSVISQQLSGGMKIETVNTIFDLHQILSDQGNTVWAVVHCTATPEAAETLARMMNETLPTEHAYLFYKKAESYYKRLKPAGNTDELLTSEQVTAIIQLSFWSGIIAYNITLSFPELFSEVYELPTHYKLIKASDPKETRLALLPLTRGVWPYLSRKVKTIAQTAFPELQEG